MLVDDVLPVYDISDAVATVADADVATTWDALMDVDLIEVGRRRPLVAALGALRSLPELVTHLLHGEAPPRAPEQLRLRDMPTLRKVAPEAFREFREPGYAKTIYSLSVRAIEDRRTLLSGVMRTATTDEQLLQRI